MALEQKCPACGTLQKLANKKCKCSYNLARGRKDEKVPIYIRLPGGRRKKLAMSVEEARTKKARVTVAISEGLDPGDENATVRDLAAWYLEQRTVKRLRTYRDVVRTVNKFTSLYGDKKISDYNRRLLIKKSDIRGYQLIRTEDDGLKPASVDREVSVIKTMFTVADDDDMINPACLKAFKGVKRQLIRGGNARRVTIPLEDFVKIYEASDDMFRRILTVALYTGMRAGEIRKLTPEHTTLESHADKDNHKINVTGLITLGPEMTKEPRMPDDPKLIPVTVSVGDALAGMARHISMPNYFWGRKGVALEHAGIVKRMRASCKAASIPYGRNEPKGITFHDIRRTTKTLMEESGMRKSIRDAILGHRPNDMDRHYIQPPIEKVVQEMTAFDKWLTARMSECTICIQNCIQGASANDHSVIRP